MARNVNAATKAVTPSHVATTPRTMHHPTAKSGRLALIQKAITAGQTLSKKQRKKEKAASIRDQFFPNDITITIQQQ